jgi:hypothetical protein
MVAKTSKIDKYYQILGLNSEASEEEIKQAYRDLVNVWHPDRFPHSQRLREKAHERLIEINVAYENLKSCSAGNSRDIPKATSRKFSSTESGPHEQSKPFFDEGQRGFSQPFTQKSAERISWKLLCVLFGVLGAGIGTNFKTRLIGAISGFLIGMGAGTLVNKIAKSRQYKIKVAWGVAVAGLLVFAALFGLTAPERHKFSSSEDEESKRIGFLFENIRQANLQKDIDLFMSCFSSDFSDKEGKRQDRLKVWETFNYQDLSYELKGLTLLGDAAVVKSEWIVVTSEGVGGKPHNGTTLLDLTLRREDGCWKITRIKPASSGSDPAG